MRNDTKSKREKKKKREKKLLELIMTSHLTQVGPSSSCKKKKKPFLSLLQFQPTQINSFVSLPYTHLLLFSVPFSFFLGSLSLYSQSTTGVFFLLFVIVYAYIYIYLYIFVFVYIHHEALMIFICRLVSLISSLSPFML